MDAAQSVFAERGYHATNIHEICARADVGIGTFYAHFDHKKDLLARIMAERVPTLPDMLTAEDLVDHERLASKVRAIADDAVSAGLWRAFHQAALEDAGIEKIRDEWRRRTHAKLAGYIRTARADVTSADLLAPDVIAWAMLVLVREIVINERVIAPDADTLAGLFNNLIVGSAVAHPAPRAQPAARAPRRIRTTAIRRRAR
jgi:AcrR family transcriptional regulator